MLLAVTALATSRLVLRPLARTDADDVFAIFSDPEALHYWSRGPMTDVAEAEAMIAEAHEVERHQVWAITRRDRDQVIGTCSLFRFSEQNRRA